MPPLPSASLPELPPAQTHQTLAETAASDDPCDGEFLFIISCFGRSGSTTILSMLNAAAEISLSGEKGAALCTHWQGVSQAHVSSSQTDQVAAWLDTKSHLQSAFAHAMCTWVRSFEPRAVTSAPPVKIRGFKEIRDCWLPLLRRAFPNAKFVLNYRMDIEAQAHSGFLRKNAAPPDFVGQLAKNRELLRGADVFELPLENFTVPTFNRLLRWVGIEGCTYRYVLHDNANNGYTHITATRSRPLLCAHAAPTPNM